MLVLTFTLCVLRLIIQSYVLTLHILRLSAYIHKHCHIFLHGCWLYILLFILLLFLFNVVNRKPNLHSFYSFDAMSSLNYFIYISEARFCIYPRSWFSTISTLENKILISIFFQSIFCIALQQRSSFWCFFSSISCTFFSAWLSGCRSPWWVLQPTHFPALLTF